MSGRTVGPGGEPERSARDLHQLGVNLKEAKEAVLKQYAREHGITWRSYARHFTADMDLYDIDEISDRLWRGIRHAEWNDEAPQPPCRWLAEGSGRCSCQRCEDLRRRHWEAHRRAIGAARLRAWDARRQRLGARVVQAADGGTSNRTTQAPNVADTARRRGSLVSRPAEISSPDPVRWAALVKRYPRVQSAADRTLKKQISHNDLSIANRALHAEWSFQDIVDLLMWLHQRNGERELTGEEAAALVGTAVDLRERDQRRKDMDD